MPAKDEQKLRLVLSASEMESLVEAARLAGSDDVPGWAKDVLLKAAKVVFATQPERIASSGGEKASTSRPKCTCGGTSGINGECDGSCIMRF